MYKSEITSEWIQAYTQKRGEPPRAKLIAYADRAFALCEAFQERGRCDKKAGEPPLTMGELENQLARCECPNHPMREELHLWYMMGYEEATV